jgi:hypothetical protein
MERIQFKWILQNHCKHFFYWELQLREASISLNLHTYFSFNGHRWAEMPSLPYHIQVKMRGLRIQPMNERFVLTPDESRLHAAFLKDIRVFSDEIQLARKLLQLTVSPEVWEDVQTQVVDHDAASMDSIARIRTFLKLNCGGVWTPFRESQTAAAIDSFRPFMKFQDYFEAKVAFKRFKDERVFWEPNLEYNTWIWPEYRERFWWTSRLKAPEMQDLRESIRADDAMTLTEVKRRIELKMSAMRNVHMEDAESASLVSAMVAVSPSKTNAAVFSSPSRGGTSRQPMSAERMASIKCYNCFQYGHISANCDQERREVKKSSMKCFRCGGLGHASRDCPSETSLSPVVSKSPVKRSFVVVHGKDGASRKIPAARMAAVFDIVRAHEDSQMAASAVGDTADSVVEHFDVGDFDVDELGEIAEWDETA